MKLPDLPEALSSRRVLSHFPPTLLAVYDNNYGLFLIAMSMFFFAAMSLSVKYLMETTQMSTLTLILVRMGITGGCCWAVLWGVQRDPHPILGPPDIRRLLLFRGLCGFSGLLCAYQALRHLSVSDTVTIQFLGPTVTGLLGWLLLKEPFTIREATAGIASLCGVVLISRPPFIFGHGWGGHGTPIEEAVPVPKDEDRDRVLGATWALIGVFFSSGAYLSIRKIGKRANALHSIGYFSLGCIIASSLGILFTPGQHSWPKETYDFALIIVIGVFGFIAQALLTFGLQREKAGRAGLASYMQILFAVVLELLIFHTIPSFLSFIGMTIILSAAAWVAMDTLKSAPPPRVEDPESEPISRTPSPSDTGAGTKTVRGELYSYASVPTTDPAVSTGQTLRLPSPAPEARQRADSSASLNGQAS